MKVSLIIPDVNARPTDRPRACRYCQKPYLHGHGTLTKPVRDHKLKEAIVRRYKCLSCGRTFRHYPPGITNKDQSQRTVILAALMYGLGLSCSATSHLLGALGVDVSKITAWRDAQEAGEALRRSRATGRVQVLGADETVFKVRGREVVIGFVVDGQSGRTLGFEVLFKGDGEERERQIGRMHREYLWAQPPTREEGAKTKEKASCGYRMRMLTLELWQKWKKILLHLREPELKLDGTNNASERAIGRSKVRYKTMRGYKSDEGMENGIGLT